MTGFIEECGTEVGRPLSALIDWVRSALEGINVPLDIDVLDWPQARRATRIPQPDDEVLPLRFARDLIIAGPLPIGGGTCPECLEHRWGSLRTAIEIQALSGDEGHFADQSSWLTPFGAEALRTLVMRAGSCRGASKYPFVLVLDLADLAFQRWSLIPNSGCSRCGSLVPDTASGATLRLRSRSKSTPLQMRLSPAREVIRTTEDIYLNPVCGLLGHHPIYDTAHQLNVQVRGRFCEPGAPDVPIDWGGNTSCYRDSLATGLLEGLERYAGLRPRAKTGSLFESFANLGHEALDPVSCGVYERIAYERDRGLTPFDPDMRMHWVWGYSVTEKRPLLVPYQLAYYGKDIPNEPLFVYENSSGCASGSSLEEAILHSLLELVERDSFVAAWYAGLSLPKIDPRSIRNPRTQFQMARLERINLDITLLDGRFDLDVPVVVAVLRRSDRELGSLCIGASASLDPDSAIRAALNEASSYMMGFKDRVSATEPHLRRLARDYRLVEHLHEHSLLYGLPEMADKADFLSASPVMRSVEDGYRGWHNLYPRNLDLLNDVQICLEVLKRAGLNQVVVIDQTSPEQRKIGVHTVCAIVPGLLPIDFGYYCRRAATLPRLFSIPRLAALRGEDMKPGELNPLPHMFP